MLRTKVFKHIGLALKLLIAVASIAFIYFKLRDYNWSSSSESSFMPEFSTPNIIIVILLFLLMITNWGLEVLKWCLLVSKHEVLSLRSCLKSVLAGITLSVFTPNRIGEFGGKIFFLQKANRGKALVSSILGSYIQLCTTILFGAIGLSIYVVLLQDESAFIGNATLWLFFLWLLVLAMVFALPYSAKWLSAIKRLKDYIGVINFYSMGEMLRIFMLSILRYIVFTTQFLLILYLFPVEISIWEASSMIMLTFLGITIIPTVTIAEIGVRGSAALLFIGTYEPNHVAILSASFLLWIINIAIPAIAGVPHVFSLTFFRSKDS